MANNNIYFRGEVSEMSAAYFVREMESLAPRSSASIYLHTPGGDIYAGGEMVNALRAACKRGCKLTVEVGSLCASMGAAILAAARACGCKAKCHPNSKVMFHGCWSIIAGGADELTDQAKAMLDFNECVKRDLRKCGVADTDDWFAADRKHWLNADELLSLGLVDEIMEAACADPEDMKSDAVKIAALLNHKKESAMSEITIKAEEVKPEEAAPVATPETPAEAAPAVEEAQPETTETQTADPAPAPSACPDSPAPSARPDSPAPSAVTPADLEARATVIANQRFAGLQAKHEKMICDLVKERDAALKDLAAAQSVATSLQADIEKLEADLASTRDQLTKSEHNRESIVADALAPAAELPTMSDGLAACKTLAERAAFLNAGNFKHN